MKPDLKTLGGTLKQRRMELNLSLKEAQNATSIQTQHLLALEEGDMDHLISPVYAQGFLKQYAKFLGLDGEKLIRENVELFQYKGKQEFDYGIGTMEVRGSPTSPAKWLPSLLWALGTSAMVIFAWLIARYFEIF